VKRWEAHVDKLKIGEAFTVYSKSRDVIVQLWSFYSVVTLGVLGFTVGSGKLVAREPFEVAMIVGGYVFFALGNAFAVVCSQREVVRMAKGISLLMAGDSSGEYFQVRPIPAAVFALFYLVMTSAVAWALIARLGASASF
jgi:hypothetical protein